jgi:Acetyl-CoA carboxylase beta subunit
VSNWLDKLVPQVVRSKAVERKTSVPDGLWSKCDACQAVLYQPELERNQQVCPKCGHHGRLDARARLKGFLDPEDQIELFSDLQADDRLKFRDQKKYKDRLSQAQKATQEKDALIAVQEPSKHSR